MTFKWPKGLDDEDKMLHGIGALVSATASLEYFFFVVLQCLTEQDGQRHSEAIWLSHRSTFARVQMVLAAARLNNLEPGLLKEVEQCAAEMKGLSRLRNYYGHARLVKTDDDHAQFEGFELASEPEVAAGADPVRATIKTAEWQSFKELKDAVERAERLYVRVLDISHRMRKHTGALHVSLPERS